ncbi:hypothetical protein EIP86_004112 [Pleurotus ostreatoroseus]|nr:hypothetical protein EIP86_004112 [Pleurotus ostreatoroseus]
MYAALCALPSMKLGSDAPAMPAPGHRAHCNALSVRPEHWRKLRGIALMDKDRMDAAVVDWMTENMPIDELNVLEPNRDTGEHLTIPVPAYTFYVPDKVIGRPSDFDRCVYLECILLTLAQAATSLMRWVIEYPLDTVQRIMHVAFPETEKWCFSAPLPDVDDSLFRGLTWNLSESGISVESTVAVLVQPPWIASAHDLEHFVSCIELPTLDPARNPNAPSNDFMNNSQRLWAKIWDFCARRKCLYWVLTTYWGWVFGAFSQGRAHAGVWPIRSFDAKEPTIVEHLVYWIAASMDLKKGEESQLGVDEALDIFMDDKYGPPDSSYQRAVPPPPSVTSWSASSRRRPRSVLGEKNDADPQQELDEDEEANVMELLITRPTNSEPRGPPFVVSTAPLVRQNILAWQRRQADEIARLPWATFSVAPSTFTVSSAGSTVRDFNSKPEGAWLANMPEPILEE